MINLFYYFLFYLPIIFLFIWFLANLGSLIFYVYLWQLKEYRWDRIRAHLETRLGKKSFFNLPFFSKLLLLFLFLAMKRFGVIGLSLLFLIFLIDAGRFFSHLWRRRFKKPKFTPKAILLLFSTLLLQVFIFIFFFLKLPDFVLLIFLIINLALPLWVAFSALVLSFPTEIAKKRIYKKAREKIKKYPDLVVIGITGSFGKTSVKEFLKTILSESFCVLATKKHNNTPIGVARQILDQLNSEHKIYIVEMGAYRRGEIKEICEIVFPKIAIITGLGFQHLSLFGSLENLVEAKYELIDSLPENGLVILNGDDKSCLKMGKRTRLDKIFFSIKKEADFRPEKVKITKDEVRFRLKKDGQSQDFRASLLGRQNVANLVSSTAAAYSLEMKLSKIAQGVAKIKPLPGTMSLLKRKGIFLIDDSYNCNPEGVLAALDYLKIFDQRKIMIFQPMIELGKMALAEHYRVFKKSVKICDQVFLTNQNYYSEAAERLTKKEKEKIIIAPFPKDFLAEIFQKFEKKDAILFEGLEAKKYLELF